MKTDLFGASNRRGGRYRSLDFEPDLMARIGRPRPSFRPRPARRRFWVGAMLLAAFIAAGVLWIRESGDERAIAHMAATAFEWLRDGRIDPVSVVTANPAPAGLGFLVGDSAVSAESQNVAPHEEPELRQAILARIRAQIESDGGRWIDARPLAFGGVRAHVVEPGAEPATAITGNIYIDADGRVYAVELSAERVHDSYVPTDFWQCTPLDSPPTDLDRLEDHARQCYEAFMSEPAPPAPSGQEIQILNPEPIFIRL